MFFSIRVNAGSRDTIASGFRFRTIVIDLGHGGKEAGAHGLLSLEKNVALSIGRKLMEALHETTPDVRMIMGRNNDTFIELNHRSGMANENHASLLISLRSNTSAEGTAKSFYKQIGAQILLYGYHRKGEQGEAMREHAPIYKECNYQQNYQQDGDPIQAILLNAFMHKYRQQSIRFADLLINEFRDHDHLAIIGIKARGVLVLAHSTLPAVLVETCLTNHPEEEKYLNSEAGQEEIVQSIVQAIRHYKNNVSHN